VEARVLEGVRAQDDPALAAHLGSCLRCFRTASELRELARIEGFLRGAPGDVDPGEAFWQSFPGRVADAWAAAALPPVAAPPSLWQRLSAWLLLPVPAAASGGLCRSHRRRPPAGRACARSSADGDRGAPGRGGRAGHARRRGGGRSRR